MQHGNKKAQFFIYSGKLQDSYFKNIFLLGYLVEIENSSLRKCNYVTKKSSQILKIVSHNKALNHESFCKQKHYHKLKLTNHC